jgi:hypothetical protein
VRRKAFYRRGEGVSEIQAGSGIPGLKDRFVVAVF